MPTECPQPCYLAQGKIQEQLIGIASDFIAFAQKQKSLEQEKVIWVPRRSTCNSLLCAQLQVMERTAKDETVVFAKLFPLRGPQLFITEMTGSSWVEFSYTSDIL